MRPSFKKSLLVSAIVSMAAPQVSWAENTEDIVISASRVEMVREASGSAITVLDSDYLEQNQIRIASDALRDVPGLAVSRTGGAGTQTQVRIRGAEANQTLVLIDGIEVNDVGAGSEFDFADLLGLEIERVEILRGAQSALWGSDAMGGVINIVTKKGRGPLKVKASVEGGSFGTHQETFVVSGGNKEHHYALSGILFQTDGISAANEDRGNTEKDGYKNATVNFKGGLKATEELSLDLVLRQLDADVDTDSFAGGVGATDADSNSETQQKFGKISAQLDLLDSRWQHELGISVADTDNKSFTSGAQTYTSQGYKRKLEYQTNYSIDREDVNHRLTLAAEREEEEFYSSSSWSTVDREMDVTGVVLEYGVNLGDQYYATIAGRRDINSMFQNANTYRLTFAGWVTDAWRIHASKGTGIKNPTLFELFGSTSSFSGNANLRPEENATWDLGAEYHFEGLDGYVDATLYNSDVKNLITGSGTTSVNLNSDSRIRGLEVSAVLNPSDDLRINASYTYTDTDDGSGQQLVRRARHIASINASHLFANGKTRLTGGLQYNGDQQDYEFDAFWNRTLVTLSGYTLANIALSHQYSDRVEFFARVENLFDEDYEEVLTYGTKGINGMLGVKIKGGL